MHELVHFCRVNGPPELYKTIQGYEQDHWLIDTAGRRYLDTMSGCRTSILGYDQQAIKDAMVRQLETLPYYPTVFHSHNAVAHDGTAILNRAFPNNAEVFYTPTGSLANETAIKLATKYWELEGAKDKIAIAYMAKSYHGTTGLIGCASDQPINELMNLNLKFPSFRIDVAFGRDSVETQKTLTNVEDCFKRHNAEIAALILDPITASGLYAYDADFWVDLRFLADKYDVLIILDEVVTGFGKTGHMFASDKWNIQAEIVTLGKGMANGYFPLAATLCHSKVTQKLSWLLHGMTFSSHPVGMAAFIANYGLTEAKLPVIRRRFDRGIHKARAKQLVNEHILSVRVHGVLGGLTSSPDLNVRLIEEEGWRRGIVVYAGGGPRSTKLTWCLPVTLSDEEIGRFFDTLQEIFDDISAAPWLIEQRGAA